MSEIKIKIKPKGQPEQEFTGTNEYDVTADAIEAITAVISSTTVDYHVVAPTDEVRDRIEGHLTKLAGKTVGKGKATTGSRIIDRRYNEGGAE